MSSVNKVILVGNLGSKPEVKQLQGGNSVANFSVATNKSWTDKGGQSQTKTEWHKIVVWGKQAENCAKYLDKGRQVYVEGELQTRQWEKDGQKHYTTEVNATTVQFLGGAASSAGVSGDDVAGTASAGGTKLTSGVGSAAKGGTYMEEDLPF